MKKYILILFLLISKLVFGQINNGGFEVWDTTFTAVYSNELSSIFDVPNPTGGSLPNWIPGTEFGISQTTDSYSGNYALILHNWYGYANEWVTYRDSLSYRPEYLQGYFKYITGGNNMLSQGKANITLTRSNGTSTDTIATGTYQFDSTVVYTPFQIDLNYNSTLTPDSIEIYIINSNSNCGSDIICNLLYLDNLTLSNSPLSTGRNNLSDNSIKVYPNPFSWQTTLHSDKPLKDATLTVYTFFGRQVKQIENISGHSIKLFRHHLLSGLYNFHLTQDGKIIAEGKLVIID